MHHANDSSAQSVSIPDLRGLVGHLVIGNDLYPAYRDGDVVFHRALDVPSISLERLHGLECVVRLANGVVTLRQISLQANGRVTLLGYHMPPMLDQDVVAAAPVELVQRRLPPDLM